jgi:hypothetical protein|tara:strand:+ start:1753 stop:1965 length:213 start_codon:yes stop_codon:yes gene_type:complete
MKRFNCEPDDELYDDDINDADEEYPREDDDGHPGPFASINQIVAYYENKWAMPGVMSGFPEIGEDDALGS